LFARETRETNQNKTSFSRIRLIFRFFRVFRGQIVFIATISSFQENFIFHISPTKRYNQFVIEIDENITRGLNYKK